MDGGNQMKEYYDSQSAGDETIYRTLAGLCYTGAVKAFAEEKKAYWLIDMVWSYLPRIRRHNTLNQNNFLIVTLDLNKTGSGAKFTVKEDTGSVPIIVQKVPFTDLDTSVKLYLIDGALMFPSEY